MPWSLHGTLIALHPLHSATAIGTALTNKVMMKFLYVRRPTVTQSVWRWQSTSAPVSLTHRPLPKPPPTCWHHRLSASPCQCCTVPESPRHRRTRHDYEPAASWCLLPAQTTHDAHHCTLKPLPDCLMFATCTDHTRCTLKPLLDLSWCLLPTQTTHDALSSHC